MGKDLSFRRLAEDQIITEEPKKKHLLNLKPELVRGSEPVFFIGLKNGHHASFLVVGCIDESIQEYSSSNHRHFKRAPPGTTHYSFDGTRKTPAGWKYKVQWWAIEIA